jgi:hypothetical protein
MSSTEEVLDKAIGVMQDTAARLLGICKDKMHRGKSLNVLEVKELRELIELIADGLDKDSLLIEETKDAKNNEDDKEDSMPSDVTWPSTSPQPDWTECLSREDHIEYFWGVEYDSDAMPNFSD